MGYDGEPISRIQYRDVTTPDMADESLTNDDALGVISCGWIGFLNSINAPS